MVDKEMSIFLIMALSIENDGKDFTMPPFQL